MSGLPITWGHSEFILLPERAVFWPHQNALFCSDLHWGRENYLQKMGFPVPDISFKNESLILEDLLARTGACELWLLGDFIHHPRGLSADLVNEMSEWMKGLLDQTELKNIRLIPGNHDREVKKWKEFFPFTVDEGGIEIDGYRFLHEPKESAEKTNAGLTWFGHLHPSFRVPMLGAAKLPCFWLRKQSAFLPAFSRLAGGMAISQLEKDDRVVVVAGDQAIEMPQSMLVRAGGFSL